MRIVDCKGLVCPMPLIETKKAIRESKIGDELLVEVDNETSFNNLSHFLNDNGLPFEHSKKGIMYRIKFIVKELQVKPQESKVEVKPTVNQGSYTIVFSSNSMGSGDDDLGKLLMKGYINTNRSTRNSTSGDYMLQ